MTRETLLPHDARCAMSLSNSMRPFHPSVCQFRPVGARSLLAEADALVGSDDDGFMIDREWLEEQWRRQDVLGSGAVKPDG